MNELQSVEMHRCSRLRRRISSGYQAEHLWGAAHSTHSMKSVRTGKATPSATPTPPQATPGGTLIHLIQSCRSLRTPLMPLAHKAATALHVHEVRALCGSVHEALSRKALTIFAWLQPATPRGVPRRVTQGRTADCDAQHAATLSATLPLLPVISPGAGALWRGG